MRKGEENVARLCLYWFYRYYLGPLSFNFLMQLKNVKGDPLLGTTGKVYIPDQKVSFNLFPSSFLFMYYVNWLVYLALPCLVFVLISSLQPIDSLFFPNFR